ncbi:hypothetical protein HJC23_003295 [Cyclotella cryptica]|uniref:Uncharacterized protein n=1 Tax=Cyclotella cryptica TaxID=29204 RepID=A0ABD3QXQ9_9STRA
MSRHRAQFPSTEKTHQSHERSNKGTNDFVRRSPRRGLCAMAIRMGTEPRSNEWEEGRGWDRYSQPVVYYITGDEAVGGIAAYHLSRPGRVLSCRDSVHSVF